MKRLVSMVALAALSSVTGCGNIHTAAREGNVKDLREWIKVHEGANFITNDEPHIPLCTAVIAEQSDSIRVLLEEKSITETKCQLEGSALSPLEIAVRKKNGSIVKTLLAAGASPTFTAYSQDGSFLLSLLYDKPANVHLLITAYLETVRRSHGDKKVRALVDASDSRWSVLSYAAYHGDKRTLEALLSFGADASALAKGEGVDENDPWPIIFWARAGGHKDCVALLAVHGAERSAKTKQGNDYETVVAKRQAVQHENAERKRQDDEQWKAWQRADEAEARREEEENRRLNAQQNQAMWNRLNGQTPSNNPLDDNSFQERMRAQAQREQQRKEAAQAQTQRASSAPSVNDPTPKTASGAVAGGRADDDAKKKEEERKAAAEARKRDAAEKAARDKADREAKEAAAKEAAVQKRAAYLEMNRRAIRLKAGTCPGSQDYHVMGTRPDQNLCINVTFRATCATNQGASTGVLHNFTGGGSCGGSTKVISPKPSCKVDEVTVMVDDVQLCGP